MNADFSRKRTLTLIRKLTAVILVVSMFVSAALIYYHRAQAEEKVLYLKELKIFETDTEAEARTLCAQEGYTFVNADLNRGTERNYVYLGYKTTENRDEALYKISLLDMNGGYQIRDYAEMYDEIQKQNYSVAETLQMATMEFIDSYNMGSPKAKDAYEGMNLLSIPDAGNMKFGDYVVSGRTDADFYSRVMAQSSTVTISAIINLLSAGLVPYTPPAAAEAGEETPVWAQAMAESPMWEIIEDSDLSQDERDDMMRSYGDDAKALHKQMQEFATNFENSLVTVDQDEVVREANSSSLDEIVDTMDDADQSDMGVIYQEAYNLLNEYDANSDMPLGEWIVTMGNMTSDEVDLSQIYPMIDAMSYAQVKMTQLTGFIGASSTLAANEHSEEYTQLVSTTRNKLLELLGNESLSIWTNADPDMVDKKVAYTSKAIRQSAAQSTINDLANDDQVRRWAESETALKWLGIVGSAGTVLGFVFSKFFLGGLTLLIAKYAGLTALATAASTIISIASFVTYVAGIFSLCILGVTIVYYVAKLITQAIKDAQDRDYDDMPAYVVDSVKVTGGYANVNYKAVPSNVSAVGDVNGHEGHTGWVCMYTSTDARVGSPIRADENGNIFDIRFSDPNKPDDCDCVNFFGQISPGNCNTNMEYDNYGGIYINYHTEESLKNRSKGAAAPENAGTSNQQGQEGNKEGQGNTPDTVKYYYTDLIVRTAKTEEAAKAKITLEGKYIWDVNLSNGAREKFETDGQYTYLGYSITTVPEEAVRDLRVATFTPSGQLQYGEITYGCAGTLGFPATSKEENSDYPENLDGLFFTCDTRAGTPIEVGKLHIARSFSEVQAGWEPVTTFSGLPYNFSTTRYNSQGLGVAKPGRWHNYPYEYNGYCTDTDYTWDEIDTYIYYEPEKTYTSGTKYLSGIFFAFGTDSEKLDLFSETGAWFTEFTDKLKTIPNCTVMDNINLAQSFYYKGFWIDSNQKYLYLCYTWSYNPYRAIYDAAIFQGTVLTAYLPYTVQKALTYADSLSGAANKTMSYASASVAVQRSVQLHYVVRGISPENAYMTTTGLLGVNDQVPEGYINGERGGYPYGNSDSSHRMAFLPTGLYVSGYVEKKNPLTLDDIVITTNAYTASENNSVISVDVSAENTVGGTKATGVFASVQDLKTPAETAPFNLAYPTWVSDEKDKIEAGSPLYLYLRKTVTKKKYISRVFVGQSSRNDAHSDDEDILEQMDKTVDLNAMVQACQFGTDEVVLVNLAATQDKDDNDQGWYSRYDSKNRLELEGVENQPAAYISVSRTDNAEEAIRSIMLYKSSPDKAVPNQLTVGGAAYYCASNTSPIRMSNGSSYYLYYSYNLGTGSGPITSIRAGYTPLMTGQTTALVANSGDQNGVKASLYGDTTMKIFVRATYEKAPSSYFNKLYVASGKDIDECRLKLLEQGCTEYLDKDLNLGTHTTTTKSQVVLLGYRSYAVNEEAIRMKTTAAAKAAERESQMNQAIYDIICTVGEPYHPEGFLSQKYQLYYAPVIYTYKDYAGNTLTTGVDLNEGTTGPEIYMYYCSPYAAKEYNNRAKLNPNARFSSLPTDYIASPITEICLARYDRIPYDTEVDASSQDGQSTEKNVLRWEYVMQANSKKHVDLNEGAAAFEANSYDAIDNRVTMFVQRENGIPKEGAEITGGYTSERENFGQVKNYK